MPKREAILITGGSIGIPLLREIKEGLIGKIFGLVLLDKLQIV